MTIMTGNKKWLAILIVFIFFFSTTAELSIGATNVVARAQVGSSVSFSSLGLISYPNPSSSMPFTGLGGDIYIGYGVRNPTAEDGNRWNTWGATFDGVYKSWVQWAVAFNGFKTTRLGFTFNPYEAVTHSLFGYEAFDAVLSAFSYAGGKVILANFDYGDTYWDSTEWWNKWLDVATYYKGDTRIAAFEIFNEMHPEIRNGHSSAWIVQYWADLTRAIHAIDPDRVVMFPTGQLDYDFASQWLPDLFATGIQNEPNMAFDIFHPYFFENSWDLGLTPEGKAQWYTDKWIIPSVAALGADRCYEGETFEWEAKNGYNHDLQQRWLAAIINKCKQYGISFNLWNGLGTPSEMEVQIEAIQASIYP